MNEALRRLISAGVYERLLASIPGIKDNRGNYLTGLIQSNTVAFNTWRLRLPDRLGITGRTNIGALYALAEEARKAVNAARNFTGNPSRLDLPPVTGLPCPGNPGGRCPEITQVTGYVQVFDPVTGVETNVPFLIRSTDQLSRQQVMDRAAQMALSRTTERQYSKGGVLTPGTSEVGTVTITSISGR
jgi:hypothetical protein